MGDTIEVALRSVLSQLSDEFEVVLVDDGSTDNSLEVLEELQREFSTLRVFPLERDRRRTLAQTRNISVELAQGRYVILHIDCDDYWHPYIKDFVKVYHLLENELGNEFLMSGFQFHMGERNYLMRHGPYRNGHMVEDRDMWFRFAKMGTWVPIDHVVFRERMVIKRNKVFRKKYLLTIRVVSDEIRARVKLRSYFSALFDTEHSHNFKYKLYKCLILPVAWVRAKILGEIEEMVPVLEWNRLKREAWQESGTLIEFFEKRNKKVDLTQLSKAGQWIFSHSSREFKVTDMK
jgi:glycosyltransferase involved in cell wall biosynthesis